ncbi:MAG: hypothetical protein ACP5T4_02550 [Candidatus Micrarchaeia archaeon]
MLSEWVVVIITLLAALMAAYAQYLFKRYLKKFGLRLKEAVASMLERHVIFGIFLYALSFALYIVALHGAPIVSFVYPIFATTFIFVFLIAKYRLGEPIGKLRTVGMLLIVVGIIAITFTY